MRASCLAVLVVSPLALSGCNAVAPAEIASVSCAGAEMGAAVAVAVATDANTAGDTGRASSRAQQTAGAVQRAVNDACPLIVGGVGALSGASAYSR